MAGQVKKGVFSVVIYITAIVVGVGGTYTWFYRNFFSPVQSSIAESSPFIIERGWNLKSVCYALEEQGFVRNWWATWFLARLKGEKLIENGRSKIKPGEYSLSRALTPLQILQKFINEEIVYHELRIPEGSTIKDIAEFMAKTTLTTRAEAWAALNDQNIMNQRQIPASSLEGYVFPSTYQFTRPDNATTMVQRMVEEGLKRTSTQEVISRASDLAMSMKDILILASIIEKETGNPDDRKKISSVFHNRLRLGMPLQSDPTVIYGIPDFNGNLTKDDLSTPTRYNTYIYKGLPPTPICNPGMDSVMAALYPEDTDFLYFVARGDGTSEFSPTYKKHQEAVRKYQLKAQ